MPARPRCARRARSSTGFFLRMAEVTGGGAHVPDRAGAKSAILEFLHGLQLPPYQFGYATGHEETLARRVGSTSPPPLTSASAR